MIYNWLYFVAQPGYEQMGHEPTKSTAAPKLGDIKEKVHIPYDINIKI